KIIGITGTNGKTTTAMLTHRILQEAGYETFLCGNIGLPMTAICEKTTNKSLVVCEVSNFQLETSKYFRPNIACILNIKPDHIDRHGSFEEYKNTKAKIAQKMKMSDVLYLNFDDKETKKMLVHKNYRYFSKQKLQNNVFVDNDYIYIKSTPTIKTDETKLAGEKNLENILASISICSNFKIKPEQYQRALKQFAPAKHRIEIVGTIKGVTYVDDSKATNIASTIACVEAFKDKNKIVLMGGLGKDIEYDDFFSKQFSIKEVICFGSDADKIKNSAEKYAYKTTKFQRMFQAVLHHIL
ncbi:MAG: UDP-N-acetylmuramoyl-L-alanine--D-glutamate ligase, partial [Clostridia bacterium]|nr:UDP-N-acetylmuramoyl-L-alanine--D-glutamate ligase [Clostridia bacterium]